MERYMRGLIVLKHWQTTTLSPRTDSIGSCFASATAAEISSLRIGSRDIIVVLSVRSEKLFRSMLTLVFMWK